MILHSGTDAIRVTQHKMFRSLTIAALLLLSATFARAQDQKKFAYSLLIDNTGSMRSQFSTELGMGREIIRQVHAHGNLSIYDFHSEGVGRGMKALPIARIEATQNEGLLNRTLEDLYVEGGQTTLLDAIKLMADSLSREPAETTKIIIVITDGEDRVSTISKKELIEQLKQQKVVVFAVGLVEELESQKSKAIDLLKALTKETGGRAVIPRSKSAIVSDVLTELALPIQ
jgi:von Willebrand factor type A domain